MKKHGVLSWVRDELVRHAEGVQGAETAVADRLHLHGIPREVADFLAGGGLVRVLDIILPDEAAPGV